MKVQAHSSLETPLEYNQDQTSLMSQGSLNFLITLGVMEILYSFIFFLEGKTCKEIPRSSKLEFLEEFLGNNFALSDAEDIASKLWKRRGIAYLPFLRTLFAIWLKSWKPSFWEVMDSFVLLAYMQFWQVQEPFCNDC